MKKRKIFMFITVFVLVLTLLPLSVTAQAPQIMGIQRPFSWDSTYGIYYLQGDTIEIETAYLGGAPTSITVTWCDVPVKNLNISINSSTKDIIGSFVPQEDDYLPGEFPGYAAGNQPLYNSPGNIKITLSNADGSVSREKAGYVTFSTLNHYTAVDPNFYYLDEYTNYFVAIATPPKDDSTTETYNCLAYVIDDYTQWHWPWVTSDNRDRAPSLLEVENFFLNPNRPGTTFETVSTTWVPFETKVIFYKDVGLRGAHFAKVVSYNSDGSPKVIMSKWGEAEVIRSDSYDPFISTYGTPALFIQ